MTRGKRHAVSGMVRGERYVASGARELRGARERGNVRLWAAMSVECGNVRQCAAMSGAGRCEATLRLASWDLLPRCGSGSYGAIAAPTLRLLRCDPSFHGAIAAPTVRLWFPQCDRGSYGADSRCDQRRARAAIRLPAAGRPWPRREAVSSPADAHFEALNLVDATHGVGKALLGLDGRRQPLYRVFFLTTKATPEACLRRIRAGMQCAPRHLDD